MKKVLLIVNPTSGGEKAPEYSKVLRAKLELEFEEVIVKETKGEGDAREFASQAADDAFHSVFVMGGDGSVNETISGLAEKKYRPNFGFIPLGTVNDLARSLQMPLDPEECIQQIRFDSTRPIDIGKINNSYFMNVVGMGTIPESVNNTPIESKTKFGKLAYFISGIKEAFNNKPHQFKVTLDGLDYDIESSLLLVGLTNSIGGFESLVPNAEVNDGLLHLIYLKDASILDTVRAVPELLKGITESNERVGYHTFEKGRIALTDNSKMTTNVDGDEGDALPIDLAILKHHIQVYTTEKKDA